MTLLLFLPVNPSISQIMQASLQKDFIAGVFPHIGGWLETFKCIKIKKEINPITLNIGMIYHYISIKVMNFNFVPIK